MMKDFFAKIKNNKKMRYALVAILLAVVILIVFFNFNSGKKSVSTVEDKYVADLENRLSGTLSRVEGVGKVSVVITVESGMETVLAMKTTTTQTSAGTEIVETPILVNGKTVVLKEAYPKIIGVLIVAEGVENIMVLSKVQQAAVSLLDINVNQIEILSMK